MLDNFECLSADKIKVRALMFFFSEMVVGLKMVFDFFRDLHNNKLTGPIPPQIGRLRRLKVLYVPLSLLSLFFIFVYPSERPNSG